MIPDQVYLPYFFCSSINKGNNNLEVFDTWPQSYFMKLFQHLTSVPRWSRSSASLEPCGGNLNADMQHASCTTIFKYDNIIISYHLMAAAHDRAFFFIFYFIQPYGLDRGVMAIACHARSVECLYRCMSIVLQGLIYTEPDALEKW